MFRYTALFLALALLPLATALGRGAKCTSDAQCDELLSCVGNPPNMRCFMKKARGMRCGQDPFWVCQDGLVCEDNMCKITVAGECTEPRSVCAEGLSCVGNERVKKCFTPKGPGMRCGRDPFWVCREGLTCESGLCTTRVAGACNDPSAVCSGGLSCVGNEGNKRCFKRKPTGMPCGKDPFWVCEDGLACVDSVCKKAVGRGKRCGARRVCKSRFVCAGPARAKRCVRAGRIGGRCGMFDTCRDSTCVDGKCVA